MHTYVYLDYIYIYICCYISLICACDVHERVVGAPSQTVYAADA